MVRRNERRSGASSPELRKAGECLKLNFNNDAPQSKLMTRKDSEKDSERPHYYSQFWLDVAAGRRIIGTPKSNEEDEQTEAELLEPVLHLTEDYVSSVQQSTTTSRAATNGRAEGVVSPEVEPEIEDSS